MSPPQTARPALDAIAAGRCPWTPEADLEPASLAAAVAAGYAERWDRDRRGRAFLGGPLATLTPWGAAALGLELDDSEATEDGRWVPPGTRRPIVLAPEWPGLRRLPEGFDPEAPAEEFVEDEFGDGPLTILGVPVRRDRRIKPGRRCSA